MSWLFKFGLRFNYDEDKRRSVFSSSAALERWLSGVSLLGLVVLVETCCTCGANFCIVRKFSHHGAWVSASCKKKDEVSAKGAGATASGAAPPAKVFAQPTQLTRSAQKAVFSWGMWWSLNMAFCQPLRDILGCGKPATSSEHVSSGEVLSITCSVSSDARYRCCSPLGVSCELWSAAISVRPLRSLVFVRI